MKIFERKRTGSMKTADERITMLHKRAAELERQKRKIQMAVWGSVSACLSCFLFIMVWQAGSMSCPVTSSPYMGSSMLGENVGAYVLVAVAAFIVGVVITVILRKYRNRDHKPKE